MLIAKEQTEFDFLIIFSKPLLRIDEVGSVLRYGKDAVYELIDDNRLEAHKDEQREGSMLKVTRRSLAAYLAATAQYKPDDFVDVVFGLARRLTPKQRDLLLSKLQSL